MRIRTPGILLAAIISFPPLMGQCVMCNRTAAAQNLERARVLNLGIAILLVPPFVILTGLVWFAYRRTKC